MSSNNGNFTVIHLSTGHLGGAGIAARRLNAALNESGISSRFYALGRRGFVPEANEFTIGRNILIKFLSYLTTSLQERVSSRIFFSILSLNSLPNYFKQELAKIENPILHIHNWYNLISLSRLKSFAKIGIPIVVTLHDQRIMTGGCHYTFECKRFTSTCDNCPGISPKLKKIPRFVLSRSGINLQGLNQDLTFVAPSKWMLNQAQQSKLLEGFETRFIPNVLHQQEYTIHSTKVSGSSKNFIVFGIASMNPSSFVKGGDIVSALIQEVESKNLPYRFSFMKSFPQDRSGLEEFWRSLDYLLVFSRAENSPNVIHEAKFYGVPVIATKTGGITELLHPEYDLGVDINLSSPSEILRKIEDFLLIGYSRVELASMHAQHEKYAGKALDLHIHLYRELKSK